MFPFDFLGRWFWALMILVSLINLVAMRSRTDKLAQGDPQKKKMYTKILNVSYGSSIITFLVMGIGILIGGVPTMFHFFRPQDGNPFVLALLALIVVFWSLNFYWVFFRGGAQILAEHPGAVTKWENPLLIKLSALLMLVGGIVGIFMMFRIDFPADEFFAP